MSGNDNSGEETRPGLTRLVHEVDEVGLGEETRLEGGRLTVSAEEAEGLLADPALAEVRVSWVSPGESARICLLYTSDAADE